MSLRYRHGVDNFGFRISDFGLKKTDLQSAIHNPQSAIPVVRRLGRRNSFTLVEMLVAMAITLVMMAAVVTLFANVSNSVRNRRATMELSGQIRQVRNVLQQDLQGATCPGLTWQRPESNHGYIEIIEGPYREGEASNLVDGDPVNKVNWPPSALNPEIDHATSILPSSNLPFKDQTWATDGGGLGDYDDVLMLTVRNEHKPFVGRMPTGLNAPGGFADWGYSSIESPLAEVAWFAIENPGYTTLDQSDDPTANHFFGEPGMRTVYRRTLLIAPWLDPYKEVDNDGDGVVQLQGGQTIKHVPGLLRVLPAALVKQGEVEKALACLIAFQDRYDISCRVEWDYSTQNWKIVANTLGDLTKRENRFCHFGFLLGNPSVRRYPFPLVSIGSDYSGSSPDVAFLADPEIGNPTSAKATANILGKSVVSYAVDPVSYAPNDPSRQYKARPFAYVDSTPTGGVAATAQAMLNHDGQVVRVMHGPVPLWGSRQGEDVQLTDVLAFDLRVFDPGAPLFATWIDPKDQSKGLDVVLTPSDPGWRGTAKRMALTGHILAAITWAQRLVSALVTRFSHTWARGRMSIWDMDMIRCFNRRWGQFFRRRSMQAVSLLRLPHGSLRHAR